MDGRYRIGFQGIDFQNLTVDELIDMGYARMGHNGRLWVKEINGVTHSYSMSY